ncbi:MAG: universal stress protein [Gammaproteobacteria bacterium]|nr:universal stress protein [Pseudomonadales bacterium]MCP5345421.1 universal stress protein [Pseudomonadales bacterium]
MLELNKILVVIEPGVETQPALERARQLARFADAELELFLSDYSTYLEDGYYFDPVRARELRREHGEKNLAELEGLAGPLRENGLEVSCATAWGNPPYEEIIRRVDELKPDLVIKSTRPHERLARLLLSNEDWELIRYCPAPLLLVKDRDWSTQPGFVAAVDPEHSHDKPAALDHKLVRAALELARVANGSVHLYHCTHLPPLSGMYPIESDFQVDTAKVKDLGAQHNIPDEHCYVSDVEITRSLPELTSLIQASVVVMGAVSRSRLDRMLIGNTAEKVLDRLECDVLIIKPDEVKAHEQVLL